MPNRIVRYFARPYIGGNSIKDAITTVQELWDDQHVHSTMDLLGEEVTSRSEIEETVQTYLDLFDAMGTREYYTLSIKLSAIGATINPEYCEKMLRRLLQKAQEKGVPVTLDMEDARYTQVTLDLYHKLKKEFPSLGTVLQTRLFRTPKDIETLKGIQARIRLVIGIYEEAAEIAYTTKSKMKEVLLESMVILLNQGAYVEMATHDEELIRKSIGILQAQGFSEKNIEYQLLLGVPRKKIIQELITQGYVVRLYVPFALRPEASIQYLKRRLTDNPHLIRYFLNNLFRRR
jgi:proline dehydrogenase